MSNSLGIWYKQIKLRGLTPIQKQLLNDETRFIVVTAGRRARKTLITLHKDVKFALSNPDKNIYLCAPTLKQAKRIFWERLKKMLLFLPCKISETEHSIKLHNGTKIYVEGLDKPERIEGTFQIDRIHTTETADIKEVFLYEHLLPTLVDTEGTAIFEGTPDFRKPWYRDFTERAAGIPIENPKAFEGIRVQNKRNPEWVWYSWQSIDVLGDKLNDFKKIYDERIYKQEFEAEFIEKGGLVYYAFTKDNLTDREFNPELTTYLCYDFNVDPMSIILVQEDKNKFYAVKEFSYRDSNTRYSSEKTREFLENNKFIGDLYITGDYSGNQRRTSGDRTDWNIIESIFRGYNKFTRADIRPTKTIKSRTNALNSLFKTLDGEIRMYINKEECPLLYKDIIRQVYKDDGSLNDEGGKIGHKSDALSYFALNYFPIEKQIERF